MEKSSGDIMILYETDRSALSDYIYHQSDECLCFQKHTHHSYEIVFVLDGTLTCEVENTSYLLKKNDILIILPGQIHSYFTENYSKSYLCVFSNDYVADFYKKTKGKKLTNPLIKSTDAESYYLRLTEGKNVFFSQSIFYELCAQALEQSQLEDEEKGNFILSNSIAFYVQNNFAKNISLKSIAKEYGYNYTYLSSVFSENFKCRFSEYVNAFRLQQAADFLTTTDKTITSVSIECGYNTIRNFNIAFKKHYGITPSEYKKYSKRLNQF